MKKLSLSFSMMTVTALLSVPAFAASDYSTGISFSIPVLITGVVLLLIVQYIFYRLLERKFRNKQAELEKIISKRTKRLKDK